MLRGHLSEGRSAPRMLTATVAAVLAAAGVAAAMGKVAPNARTTVRQTVPVGVYTRVNVSNAGGSIVVTGVQGASSISVIATKIVWGRTPGRARRAMADLAIALNPRGDMLEIRPEHPEGWDRTYEVEYLIAVPASFRVEAVSASGVVQIRDVREVDVTTTEGGVLLSGVPTATVHTVSGVVEADSTTGPLDITTVSGPVRLRFLGRALSVHVVTTTGDVLASVPPDLNADLSASTATGLVAVDGLTLRDARQGTSGTRGVAGNGGVPFEVTTASGSITVTARTGAFARTLRPVTSQASTTSGAAATQSQQQ